MIYICNSLSLAMLDEWRLTDTDTETQLIVQPVVDPVAWLEEAEARHGTAVSAVGHEDTAIVFSSVLRRNVPQNRVSVTLDESTELLIGQLVGGRLPEGSTTLPPNTQILWVAVSLR